MLTLSRDVHLEGTLHSYKENKKIDQTRLHSAQDSSAIAHIHTVLLPPMLFDWIFKSTRTQL